MNCELDRGICSKQYGNGIHTGCSQSGYCEYQITEGYDEQAAAEIEFSIYEKGMDNF